MWRHKSYSEIHASEQIISDDDEEQDGNWPENYVSLAGIIDHKNQNLGVMSQLELLKGFHQNGWGFSSEDEVEVPDFHKRSRHCDNDVGFDLINPKADDSTGESNGLIPDIKKGKEMLIESITVRDNLYEVLDLYTHEHEKQFESSISCAFDKEVSRPHQPRERSRRSSSCSFYSKGMSSGGSYETNMSSSQLESHKEGAFSSAWKDRDANSSRDDELLDVAEASEYQPQDKTRSVLGGTCGSATSKPSLALPIEAAIQQDFHRQSMAELLDNLQGKIRNPHFKSKMGGRRKGLGKGANIRGMSLSGKVITSDGDRCECVHGGSTTVNEDNVQIFELAVVEPRRKTMAEKFQEAFGGASLDDGRPSFTVLKESSANLFGRLQHIMQRQKEQDAEYIKKVQSEVCPKDEARCIDVKILSKSFDAKLSVCHCSLLENEESSLQNLQQRTFGDIWTVIFNSRVCGDVDLEVGNLIRIYQPCDGGNNGGGGGGRRGGPPLPTFQYLSKRKLSLLGELEYLKESGTGLARWRDHDSDHILSSNPDLIDDPLSDKHKILLMHLQVELMPQ